jgi:transposase
VLQACPRHDTADLPVEVGALVVGGHPGVDGRASGPAPRAGREVGVDLGLTAFAALSTGEKVANPRWLRQREKALRRSQRAMSRKHKGRELLW